MIFRQHVLEGIRDGAITLAFRRWTRPTVKAGGTLLTAVGQLHIASVSTVTLDAISEADARRAGYGSRDALLRELGQREGAVYRIGLGALGPDPRVALRESAALERSEADAIVARLRRLDASSPSGAWTVRTLQLIASRPGVRAGDLCGLVDLDKDRFKLNLRKLKSLGLTESLDIGYRLSPRGRAILRAAEG
jgi:hypothetical protein